MRVVSAGRLTSAPTRGTGDVDRHHAVAGVVVALVLAACAGAVVAVAPGARLFAHLLVVLVPAVVASWLDRRSGLVAACAGTAGAVAGALLVAVPLELALLEGAATILVAGAVVALVAAARSRGGLALARVASLDEAVAAFAEHSATGALADAVAAGVRVVVPSAVLERLQLGPFHGPVEDLPDMVLATLSRTGERATLPDGFTRATDAVLVGLPVVHGASDTAGVVVRVPTELPDEELDRLAALLARVAPTLAAHAAAALWAEADPGPDPSPSASSSPSPTRTPTPTPGPDRDEALARAAHDLRVPLTSLAGTAETLATHGDALPPHQRRELYQVLTRSTRRVAHWVTAMLEDALGGGDVVAVPREVELGPLLEEAVAAATAATVGLDVRVTTSGEVVRADPGLVVRVVANLLANAGHHAAAGGRVELTVHGRGDEVQVRVADHGPGFDPEVLDPEPAQDKRWLGGASGAGLGLGLASARALVAAWGGSFGIGHTPGGGATVWFTLPLAERVPGPAHEPAREPAHEPVSAAGSESGPRPDGAREDAHARGGRQDEPDRDRVRWTVVAADPSSIPGHLRRR